MPGTRSSAATKCISDVPGLQKQVSTPLFSRVWTRLSAPFMRGSFRRGGFDGTCAPAVPSGNRFRFAAQDRPTNALTSLSGAGRAAELPVPFSM